MKSLLINACFVAGSILVALGIAEVGLRIWGFSYPTFLHVDPVTGHRHRPNVEGRYQDEGNATVRINSAGLRDMEHSLAKPANVVRIAILGDSYAEALQVPLEATFWKLLEAELSSHCERLRGKQVEVINFGVSGYGTAQELLALRDRVWPYQPDVVLLAFLSGNDIQDNSKALSGAYPRPYLDRKLRVDEGFLQSKTYRLKDSAPWRLMIAISDYSRVLQLFNMAKNRLAQPAVPVGRADELGLTDRIYLPPADDIWQEAWGVTETLILQIRREVESRGGRFFVATLSNGIQVHPDLSAREAYRKKLGATDLFYPDHRIDLLLKRTGIPHAILAPELAAAAQASNEYLHGFPNSVMGTGHWNELGHLYAASIIGPRLCEAL